MESVSQRTAGSSERRHGNAFDKRGVLRKKVEMKETATAVGAGFKGVRLYCTSVQRKGEESVQRGRGRGEERGVGFKSGRRLAVFPLSYGVGSCLLQPY